MRPMRSLGPPPLGAQEQSFVTRVLAQRKLWLIGELPPSRMTLYELTTFHGGDTVAPLKQGRVRDRD